ncbi:MAG: phenylalanine--tRNA ligase subunit beta [Nitrospirae bacterium GWC2_57_13]|jgi:phenylalanyl-tRNA synthetase beta chain|nr:MAG: phenylalanine--tRNA ligase subunit beta [Nitrospirae bacterium GWC2_57_13]
MPTIDIKKNDLETLIGKKLSLAALEKHLMLAKAELKEYVEKTDDLKVELSDSNRPDLWSAEGVARQIRIALTGAAEDHPYFRPGRKATRVISVAKEMKSVRPYLAACTASGLRMTDDMLAQMIQSQDKLADIFGRKRTTVSIGIYELDRIAFPVEYRLAEPSSVSFTPLGMDKELTLAEILEQHPKGKEYGAIVRPFSAYPVLIDSMGRVLSFPPIINSRDIGEVKPRTRQVLIEVTGTDMRMTALTLNILAAGFYDRGADIDPVLVTYPYATDLGKRVSFPVNMSRPVKVSLASFQKGLGERVLAADVKKRLASYGHAVKGAGAMLSVTAPPYRDDIMHSVDLVEDYAISRGYESFSPLMPEQSTVGSLSGLELLSDTVRGHMTGAGFQEIMSNILCARAELDDVLSAGERLVEVENPMSLAYSVLRNRVVPSLLRVEAASSKAFYPHRIFEAGEVAVYDAGENMGSRTELHCAALHSHPAANFSEIQSSLDILLYYLGIEYRLERAEHPLCLPGRFGRVVAGATDLGFIGELAPSVLEKRQITMPCACFEINLNALLGEVTKES